MKIGYIASNIYRHTFEINEAIELLRQVPCGGTRVYSFYRPAGTEIQSQRIKDVPTEILYWSPASVARGLWRLLLRHPAGLFRGALRLAFLSFPNPVYWFKNFVTFFLAAPILADADEHGVTHLHANFGSSPATIAWLGKVILHTKMSVTFHAFDIYSQTPGQRDPLKKRKLKDADAVIAVYQHGHDYLRALVPDASGDKFKVIPISVVFDPKEKPAPLPGPPLFLAAGNLVPKKGFDVLIGAAGILRREGINARFRILGEGAERERLQALIRDEGLGGKVEMPGYYQHSEFADHLAGAAALIVPSKVVKGGQRDGIPTVLVEAWLARTPVIASLVGGMAEVVVDGDTGLVFPPDDTAALARCIRTLLDSKTLTHTLADRGYETATTVFSAESNVRALVDTIEYVSASPRS